MKKFLIAVVMFYMTCGAIPQASAQIQVYDPLIGSAGANMISVIKFNYKYWLDARNSRLIEDAESEIIKTLRPGQSVNVYVIASGPKDTPVVQRVVRESDGDLRSGIEWIFRRDTLYWNKSPYCSAAPISLPIPSRSEFESSIRYSFSSRVTYDDYAFLIKSVNNMAQVRRIYTDYMYDFADDTALAGASGTVILTASESESTYRVYDAANNRQDSNSYRKGNNLSRMGNTVWVLCRSNSGEYVLMYTNLAGINVRVGDRVQAGSTKIGQWQNASRRGVSLYRVFGPEQYFLRPEGYPAPYPILLNN